MTALSDGLIQLLSPSSFEGAVPEHFSITIARRFKSNDNDEQLLDLVTHVGFEAWSDISRTEVQSSSSGETDIPIIFSNYPYMNSETSFVTGIDANFLSGNAFILSPTEETLLPVIPTSKEAMFVVYPPAGGLPLYYLEEALQDSLNGPNSLRLDVTNDFQEFDKIQSVTIPGGFSRFFIDGYLEGEQSFNQSNYLFIDLGYPYGMSPAANEVLVALPDIANREVGYDINLLNSTDPSIRIQERIGGQQSMPSDFTLIDTEATVSNTVLNDIQMSVTGSPDIVQLTANSQTTTPNFGFPVSIWEVFLPDSAEGFVFPFIADSLDASITAYNRSDLQLRFIDLYEFDVYDNYGQYLNDFYSDTDFEFPFNFRRWSKTIQSSQTKISLTQRREAIMRKLQLSDRLRALRKTELPGYMLNNR